jgi:hypothetical protein
VALFQRASTTYTRRSHAIDISLNACPSRPEAQASRKSFHSSNGIAIGPTCFKFW